MIGDKKNNSPKKKFKATVSSRVKDYGKDPFFVKKAEASKKVIEKYGIPRELISSPK